MELAEERIGEYEDERNNDSDNRNRFYQADADEHGSEELPLDFRLAGHAVDNVGCQFRITKCCCKCGNCRNQRRLLLFSIPLSHLR